MHSPLTTQLALPQPPKPPDRISLSPQLRKWLTESVVKWRADLIRVLNADSQQVHRELNTLVSTVGPTLESAPEITVTAPIHHVSGVATITTITVPHDPSKPSDFSGPIWLIADGMWALAPGGNIAIAKAPVVGQAVNLLFDVASATWYPVG